MTSWVEKRAECTPANMISMLYRCMKDDVQHANRLPADKRRKMRFEVAGGAEDFVVWQEPDTSVEHMAEGTLEVALAIRIDPKGVSVTKGNARSAAIYSIVWNAIDERCEIRLSGPRRTFTAAEFSQHLLAPLFFRF